MVVIHMSSYIVNRFQASGGQRLSHIYPEVARVKHQHIYPDTLVVDKSVAQWLQRLVYLGTNSKV